MLWPRVESQANSGVPPQPARSKSDVLLRAFRAASAMCNNEGPMSEAPEQRARRRIDANLTAAGWLVQDRAEIDLTAGRGIAVRDSL